MSIWWSLHLRREAASVPLARRLLLGAMETAGVDPDVSYDLSVALSEACANAVEHGGPGGPGRSGAGEYHVTAYIDDDMCRIEVTDHGPGFGDASGGPPRARGTAHTSDTTDTDTTDDTGATGSPDGTGTGADGPNSTGGVGGTAGLPAANPLGPLVARAAAPLRDGGRGGGQGEPGGGAHPHEHGRGLFLIEALADHVAFRNRPGDGAVVCFDKLLRWKKDALLKAS